MAKCKGCGQDIIWIKTDAGKSMPVDAKSRVVFAKAGLSLNGDFTWKSYRGHESHFATCPKADQFRKPKKGDKNAGNE